MPQGSVGVANLSSPTVSLINSSNAIAGLVMASTGSSIVLNVPDSRNSYSTPSASTLTSTSGQLLPPTSDENSFKFIQDAKSSWFFC